MSSFYTCVPKITIMWCMLPKTWSATHIIFCQFASFFCPFTPLLTPKITIWKIHKKTPEDIVLLHMCTINEDHMMYGSLDLKRDGQSFLQFWTFFFPLTWKTKTNLKNQNFDKMKKKPGDILILRLCNTNDDHIMYGSWDMKHHRQNFLLFWPFLPFYPTNNPKNQNVEKKKKIPGDIILHNCTKNHDHMLYCSWDMARDGCNLCFYFLPICAIFCLFTPQQPKKEKKNVWTYQYFTHVYQQLWSHDDGRTNGRKLAN